MQIPEEYVLHLFILRHPKLAQAALVKTVHLAEACYSLARQSLYPIVVQFETGWVQYPEEVTHYKDDKDDDIPLPLPRWEFAEDIGNLGNLRDKPEYGELLLNVNLPRDDEVIIGPEWKRF